MWLEVSHYSAGVAVAFLLASRRDFPREYWVVALAYMVSWFIDAAVDAGRGGFGAAHVLIGIQLALFAGAVTTKVVQLFAISLVLTVAATVAPLVMHDDPHRMVLVSLVGIPTLAYGVWHWDHRLRWPVAVYVALAGFLSAWMVGWYYPYDPEAFDRAFVVYQLARFLSLGLFIHAAYKWGTA